MTAADHIWISLAVGAAGVLMGFVLARLERAAHWRAVDERARREGEERRQKAVRAAEWRIPELPAVGAEVRLRSPVDWFLSEYGYLRSGMTGIVVSTEGAHPSHGNPASVLVRWDLHRGTDPERTIRCSPSELDWPGKWGPA
jgi:hypothetical protein